MMKRFILFIFLFGFSYQVVFPRSLDRCLTKKNFHLLTERQLNFSHIQDRELLGLGFGAGFDYGGFGLNAVFYPQKNIGIFGGFGYALIQPGYNGGLKIRFLSEKTVSPFLIGMYGYNAVIKVTGASSLNKIFYGPTVGGGIDLQTKNINGYWSFALLVPIRSSSVDDYMSLLIRNYGVTFNNALFPVTFSIGYKFRLNKKTLL